MRLSKKVVKRDNWLLLWNKAQKWKLNVLFISLEMRLSKKWLKNTLDFCCEAKVKMIVESHFHFPWIATFKKGHEIGQFDSCLYCKAKPKWRPFHFIELWQLKLSSNSLVCDLILLITVSIETQQTNRNPSNSNCGFLASPKLFVTFMGESWFILFQNTVKD